MSIRLIASDMDGTLLDPYSNISSANIDAINWASKAGAEFIICSGRDYTDAKNIMESYGIRCGYICLSGASVYDRDGTMLAKIPLTFHNLSVINRILSPLQAPLDILTSHGRYSTADEKDKLLELCSFYHAGRPFAGPIPEEIMELAKVRLSTITFLDSIADIPEEVEILKICCNNIEEDVVMSLKEKFGAYPDIAAASSFPTNIELTNADAQKGNALKAYAKLKHIPLEDIMVLGDSDNDLSMFTTEFGYTVAMENAMPCIREAAKYHTKSNREDGVAWAIKAYVNGKNNLTGAKHHQSQR